MLMSLAVGVGAAGTSEFATMEGSLTGGKITIKNAVNNEDYDLYQVMYLDSFDEGDNYKPGTENTNPSGGNYVYKLTTDWEGFYSYEINSPKDGSKTTIGAYYLTLDSDSGAITWNSANAGTQQVVYETFANYAIAYAKANGIKPVKKATCTGDPVVFSDLNLGYYLIDTTLGSLCTLDTTNKEISVTDKNSIPTNFKQVAEDSKEYAYSGSATAEGKNDDDIGATIKFRSEIGITKGQSALTFHDVMSSGLTFDSTSVTVSWKIQGGNYTELTNNESATYYEVVTNNLPETCSENEKCTFHVVFKEDFFKLMNLPGNVDPTKTIEIKYNATLNENAVIGSEGNPNTSKISYGDKNNFTPGSKTKTYTWEIPIAKTTGEGTSVKPLSGAKFSLYSKASNVQGELAEQASTTTVDESSIITFVLVKAENGDSPAEYRVAKSGETGVTEITTGNTGKFLLKGLDAQQYYLVEKEAPKGYNKLLYPVPVEIRFDTAGTATDCEVYQNNTLVYSATQSDGFVTVDNKTGTELPETGGIGTTIFYVAGSILLIGAAILLIVKKRMSNEK